MNGELSSARKFFSFTVIFYLTERHCEPDCIAIRNTPKEMLYWRMETIVTGRRKL